MIARDQGAEGFLGAQHFQEVVMSTETSEVLIKMGVDASQGEQNADRFAQTIQTDLHKIVEAHHDARDAAREQVEAMSALERSMNEVRETVRRQLEVLERMDRAQQELVGHLRSVTDELKRQGNAGEQHAQALDGLIKRYLTWGAAIEATRRSLQAISYGLDKNANLEDANLSVAGIVSSNETVRDSVGRQIEGSEKILAVQQQVRGVMDQIQKDALLTKSTTEELVRAFQSAVGPSMAVGFNLEQVEKYAVAGSRAMAALGIPLQQSDQELRSIVDGTIDMNSRLAHALVITNEQVALHRTMGDLFDYLLDKMRDLNAAGEMAGHTFSGVVSSLHDVVDLFARLSTQDLFSEMKRDADQLLGQLISVDEHGVLVVNQDLKETAHALDEIVTDAYRVAKAIGSIGDALLGPGFENLNQLRKDLKSVLAVGVGYPAAVLGAASVNLPGDPGYGYVGGGNAHTSRAFSQAWDQVQDDVTQSHRVATGVPSPLLAFAGGANTYTPIDRGTNLDATRREIERVHDLYESLGTDEGYRKALKDLEDFGRTHKLGSDATQKLTAAENQLRHHLEQRSEAEVRRAQHEEDRLTADWVRFTRQGAGKFTGAPMLGPEHIDGASLYGVSMFGMTGIGPLGFPDDNPVPLGDLGLKNTEMTAFNNTRGLLGLGLGDRPLGDVSHTIDVGELRKESEEVAKAIEHGVSLARMAVQGDWKGMAGEFGNAVQESLIASISHDDEIRTALFSILKGFQGPEAALFWANLVAPFALLAGMSYLNPGSRTDYRSQVDPYSARAAVGDSQNQVIAQQANDFHNVPLAAGGKAFDLNSHTMVDATKPIADLSLLPVAEAGFHRAGDTINQTNTIQDQIDYLSGQRSSLDVQLSEIVRERQAEHRKIDESYMGKNVLDPIVKAAQDAEYSTVDRKYDKQIELLTQQLEVQRDQALTMHNIEGRHLDNQLGLLSGTITQQQYTQREGELNIVDTYREQIKTDMGSLMLQKPKDSDLDTVDKLKTFLGSHPELDPAIASNLEKSLAILALESKAGSNPSSPMYIRDVDRAQATPLDSAIYQRALARGWSVSSGGIAPMGSEGNMTVTVGAPVVTVHAAPGMNAQEIAAVTVDALGNHLASPKGIQQIGRAAKVALRTGAGVTGIRPA